MPGPELSLDLRTARRLVLDRQLLSGSRRLPRRTQGILAVVRQLGYVQWDPVNIVAPSHLLSFSARLDDFRPADLEHALWSSKTLFEHWLPMASLVLTEDYPLFASLMSRYPGSLSDSWGSQRDAARRFLRAHDGLRRAVLRKLRQGPRTQAEFEEHERTRRSDGDWAPSSDLAEMLFHLTMRGEVMVVGHDGAQNLWGLTGEFLPASVDRTALPPSEFERQATERALRALGVATDREIALYFVRGRYQRLAVTLAGLEAEGRIHRVTVEGVDDRAKPRYVHDADLRAIDRGRRDGPIRTALLPPFDNLLGNTARIERLFGFRYVREQFLPPEKRRYGTYVLPIVRGERLIGRIDPRVDRASRRLVVQAVHAEPGAPDDRQVGADIAAAIARLGRFVGVEEVSYSRRVPSIWRRELRG